MKKLCPQKDASLLGVLTQVGTFGKPEEICPDIWGYPYVGSSDKSRKFRLSGVPTQVGTSDIPDRKSYSDLAFWIPIQTVPDSWKIWKIRLGEVSYWDNTTPLSIYERIMADWVPIYPIVKQINLLPLLHIGYPLVVCLYGFFASLPKN